MSIILETDSYKLSHFKQYPPGAKFVSSYIEPRAAGPDDNRQTLFFGIQGFLDRYLSEPITRTDVEEATDRLRGHGLPFNHDWMTIVRDHQGYLPIEIQALPEGTLVPRGVPVVQVRNTDERFPWLASYIETALLRSIWYPSSVATLSFLCKSIIYEGLRLTSDDPDGQIWFKLHDFGARGASSAESAGLGGLAHLVNFKGTDTIEALGYAEWLYGEYEPVGFSIPASEHSTMTSWGEAREAEAYANMIDQFGDGMFSIVSDSYNLWNAIENIFGGVLKEKILGMNGTLVVRPDSGDPVKTPLRTLEKLWEIFGGEVNSKGFRVLNPKVRVIQGDGMNLDSIATLTGACIKAGFSLDNIAFGMGGGLLQGHMRDDHRWAMKCNAIDFGDGWVDVQKKPATDPTKASKAGRQAVVCMDDGDVVAVSEKAIHPSYPEQNMLRVRYDNGDSSGFEDFTTIRNRAHKELVSFVDAKFPKIQEAAE